MAGPVAADTPAVTPPALAEPTRVAAPQARWLPGVRVLVVDDSDINLDVARRLLEREGASVETCGNGRQALDCLCARPDAFDLVLMDVQMPVKNGYEATRILRQELGLAVPIIALTANAITGERAKCLAAGMNDYLTKPFQEFSLLKMVYDWAVAAPRDAAK